VNYGAVDFNYESRKAIIKVPNGAGVTVQGGLPVQERAQREIDVPASEFEDRWTGAYIFEKEWQSSRPRQSASSSSCQLRIPTLNPAATRLPSKFTQ
jgi:site-specific DNA-methyltransferase (adenine-specific)/adenine-specific DNA-methyltransferase